MDNVGTYSVFVLIFSMLPDHLPSVCFVCLQIIKQQFSLFFTGIAKINQHFPALFREG